MGKRIASLCRRFSEWLDPSPLDVVTLNVPRDAVYMKALEMVKVAELAHSPAHGEAKRRHVYASLLQSRDKLEAGFVGRRNRDFAQAIEAALTEVR